MTSSDADHPTEDDRFADWPLCSELCRPDGELPPRPELVYEQTRDTWRAIHAQPDIHPTAWIASTAVVLGRVRLKEHSSIWYGCVLRGDDEWIEVGRESNVQDGAILHIDPGLSCVIGDRVTIGHQACVHASTVEDDVLIGIGATILSGCHVGAGSLIAAGALIREGTKIPAGTLWAGCPACQIREVTEVQKQRIASTARHYVNMATMFAARSGQ